jgi:uncharacterized membrane protein HdeD (DUF308 family)
MAPSRPRKTTLPLARPGVGLASLLFVLTCYAFVAGCSAVVAVFRTNKEFDDGWMLLLEGVLLIALAFRLHRAVKATAPASS